VRIRLALVLLAVLAVPAALAATGSWRELPQAPIVADNGLTGVWTGRQMIVVGRQITKRTEDGAVYASKNVAAAYDPAVRLWFKLSPLPGPTGYFPGRFGSVWTGKEVVVWGSLDQAFDPATGRWRRLPKAPSGGRALLVWTGKEMIGWGGGCCGDAFADGVAYRPGTNTWRKLQRSPLAGSQHPVGAWTGHELVVFIGGFDPDGKPWPARLARAAAYDPATGKWRRLAQLPGAAHAAQTLLGNAQPVWDGREVLVVGSIGRSTGGYAYNPGTNGWRKLPRADTSGRIGTAAVWTGKRLLVWGGQGPNGEIPGHGLAYDPKANRWSPLPSAPIFGRSSPAAVWTGHELIVWGGGVSYPRFSDGAALTPKP
jgi:Galactose oxidase, central domain